MSWAESSALRPMKPTTTTPSVEGGSEEEEEGIGMGWGEGEVAVEEGGGRMRTRTDDGFGLGESIPVEGTGYLVRLSIDRTRERLWWLLLR